VSRLRQRLRTPHPWLALLALLAALAVVDACRAPDRQWLVPGYVALVHGYQRLGRPLLAGYVRCRYVPSCSEYSAQAVERFGIARGLWMTFRRLRACNGEVPPGSLDPVPAVGEPMARAW
jgi:uncharacterized protein